MSPWVTNLPNRPEQPRVVIIFDLYINIYYNNIVINRGMHDPVGYRVTSFLNKITQNHKKLLFMGRAKSRLFFICEGGNKK